MLLLLPVLSEQLLMLEMLVPAGRSAGPYGNMGPLLLWERSSLSFPIIRNTGTSSLQSSSPSFHIADADASEWSLLSAAGRERG